jgi:hypothetical protein
MILHLSRFGEPVLVHFRRYEVILSGRLPKAHGFLRVGLPNRGPAAAALAPRLLPTSSDNAATRSRGTKSYSR